MLQTVCSEIIIELRLLVGNCKLFVAFFVIVTVLRRILLDSLSFYLIHIISGILWMKSVVSYTCQPLMIKIVCCLLCEAAALAYLWSNDIS